MKNDNIKCPKCNSDNVQTEGVLHLCLDCSYKWEDAPQTDLGEMIIYQSDDGVKLDVRLENKTVWLNVEQIAELFNKGRSTINEHILNIFKEGELDEKVVCRKFRQTTQHGAIQGKTQSKEVKFYNLDVIKMAKNYLKENELKILNNLVSGYFDFAEIMAMEHRPVYMMDYVKQLDTILQSTGRPLLKGSGSISHEEAMDKALSEYRKYQVKTLTPVEEAYLESINALGKIAKRKGRNNGGTY